MRNRSAFLIGAPSMLGGVLAAHALAYRWTVPAAQRTVELRQTGHAWFAYLPLVLAVALAALAVGLARRLLAPRSGTPAAWPFAVLPPLAFLLQEHLERLVYDGSPHLALSAPVIAGVLLAVPFGLAAYLVARILLAGVDTVSDAFRAAPARLCRALPPAPRFSPAPAGGVHAGACAGRGPPQGSLNRVLFRNS